MAGSSPRSDHGTRPKTENQPNVSRRVGQSRCFSQHYHQRDAGQKKHSSQLSFPGRYPEAVENRQQERPKRNEPD